MNLKLENLQPIASNNAEICEQWSLFESNDEYFEEWTHTSGKEANPLE
jgi:hypothetical protein